MINKLQIGWASQWLREHHMGYIYTLVKKILNFQLPFKRILICFFTILNQCIHEKNEFYVEMQLWFFDHINMIDRFISTTIGLLGSSLQSDSSMNWCDALYSSVVSFRFPSGLMHYKKQCSHSHTLLKKIICCNIPFRVIPHLSPKTPVVPHEAIILSTV